MIGWHHRLNGREFEQALGESEGQGGLACCSPWGRKELDTTERLNSKDIRAKLRRYPLCAAMGLKVLKRKSVSSFDSNII